MMCEHVDATQELCTEQVTQNESRRGRLKKWCGIETSLQTNLLWYFCPLSHNETTAWAWLSQCWLSLVEVRSDCSKPQHGAAMFCAKGRKYSCSQTLWCGRDWGGDWSTELHLLVSFLYAKTIAPNNWQTRYTCIYTNNSAYRNDLWINPPSAAQQWYMPTSAKIVEYQPPHFSFVIATSHYKPKHQHQHQQQHQDADTLDASGGQLDKRRERVTISVYATIISLRTQRSRTKVHI